MGSQGKTTMAKPHYNISMSKRTRKSQILKIEPRDSFKENKNNTRNIQEEKIDSRQIIEEQKCSLAQYFKEEEEGNENRVEIKQSSDEDGFRGVKLKKIARNYAKLLSHLINKVNQGSYIRSWRKAAPSFKFIKHKQSK
ncbi:hypothetical protein CASFOL_031245 [Castilleja foliolosa]|uniref:Uncharacterized protein n=1 Tax=Castilleja foliolosa TaxID=1961234 RepID=A0ABD3C4V4_9LAMI